MRIYKIPTILFKLFPQIYWKDSSAEKQVYLTFDDGPDRICTPQILNILREENAGATFFVLGSKAARHRELMIQIHREGHAIGIHAFTHERLFYQSENYIYQQLNHSKKIVEDIIGQPVHYFRPPFGFFSPRLIKIGVELNLKMVLWSFMTYDFDKRISIKTMLKLIKQEVTAGEILVFHDGHINSARTIQILQPAIHIMTEKGLKLVSLSK